MTAASLKRIVEEALAEVGASVNFRLVPKGKARTTTWLGIEHGFGIRHYPSGRNVYIVQRRGGIGWRIPTRAGRSDRTANVNASGS
ncbi:hypothetical protein GRI39_14025 [Altererythrobacter indicus]|uniref:Uncharacterized protein n=1 Tax=Altericroceibacterium indicum TaxID=374177 RepID=A0A845AJ76_9SPHN|nr:hypothetical protein [Altericroceibacterium indicum]MXP27148.1 hypothetical protein [Altericroceibacterium indicum]